MTGLWLTPWHRRPDSLPTLLCVPQAGAGCGGFRDWQDLLGGGVSVVGVQFPGREWRWSEPPPRTLDEVVAAVVTEVAGLPGRQVPITLFGHSLGGLVAYEVARRLARPPAALVVAACPPPDVCTASGLGAVPGDELLLGMLRARGLAPEDLDGDSLELMLGTLRRDAELAATYRVHGPTDLRCPVEVWGGDLDDTVTAEQLDGWRRYCVGPFRRRRFPGGHNVWVDRPDLALPPLRRLIGRAMEGNR
jgi:surfactin synthase thioesterase subunit